MRDSATASAPGRVNLIGEHTDYHEGYVLPTVIPQRTHVAVTRRGDRRVRALSAAFDATWAEYTVGDELRGRGWLDYVQGVTATLAARGVDPGGFDVRIDSQIPLGAGVSSSAALEVGLLRALRELLDLPLDDMELARLAHAVETGFVGVPVGIMDQVAVSLGCEGEALFLDTRTCATERVALPPAMDLVAIHSGITHAHAGGAYVTRRRESFAAAEQLGVATLRSVDCTALERIDRLPPPLNRRARHIVTENARVLEAVAAIRQADLQRLGSLLTASHASMRDDYEISTPEVDALVAIATGRDDTYGARMTGGGFGGAVVVLAAAGRGRIAAVAIAAVYAERTGRTPTVLIPSL